MKYKKNYIDRIFIFYCIKVRLVTFFIIIDEGHFSSVNYTLVECCLNKILFKEHITSLHIGRTRML